MEGAAYPEKLKRIPIVFSRLINIGVARRWSEKEAPVKDRQQCD